MRELDNQENDGITQVKYKVIYGGDPMGHLKAETLDGLTFPRNRYIQHEKV